MGLLKLSAEGAALVRAELDAMADDGTLDGADLPDLLARLANGGAAIHVFYIAGQWLDVDDVFDLATLRNLV